MMLCGSNALFAAIWSHPKSAYCFKKWITVATTRLNNYQGSQDWNANKPYSINQYGEWQGAHTKKEYPPIDYFHYQNRYHWMWRHYRMTPLGWSVPEWNNAKVPELQELITDCMRTHQPQREFIAPGWRGHNPWADWFERSDEWVD